MASVQLMDHEKLKNDGFYGFFDFFDGFLTVFRPQTVGIEDYKRTLAVGGTCSTPPKVLSLRTPIEWRLCNLWTIKSRIWCSNDIPKGITM